jgi:predicted nucleic acid-binding Zn ribbon protein
MPPRGLHSARVTPSRTFTALSQTLDSLAAQFGLQVKLLEYRLRRDWPAIVGEQVACHTRPDAIRHRKLLLIADHSVWVQHLTFLKPALIEKVNAAAGGTVVSDFIVRVGEVAACGDGGEAAAPQPAAVEASAAEPPAIDGPPLPISDEALRAHWTSVMARALRSRPAARPTKPAP